MGSRPLISPVRCRRHYRLPVRSRPCGTNSLYKKIRRFSANFKSDSKPLYRTHGFRTPAKIKISELQSMEIGRGFQLEQPRVLVPWGISEQELQGLFKDLELRHVTHGYYVAQCVSLNGLSHYLGFHFTPSASGKLIWFELFQTGSELESSYRDFQDHLEISFGCPTTTIPGSEGFPTNYWRIQDVQITHLVQEHFGPAERLRIERIA